MHKSASSSVDIIPHRVSLTCISCHMFWCCASPSFGPFSYKSFFTLSFHIFAGLPLFLLPGAGTSAEHCSQVFPPSLDTTTPQKPGSLNLSSLPSTHPNGNISLFVFCSLNEMFILASVLMRISYFSLQGPCLHFVLAG